MTTRRGFVSRGRHGDADDRCRDRFPARVGERKFLERIAGRVTGRIADSIAQRRLVTRALIELDSSGHARVRGADDALDAGASARFANDYLPQVARNETRARRRYAVRVDGENIGPLAVLIMNELDSRLPKIARSSATTIDSSLGLGDLAPLADFVDAVSRRPATFDGGPTAGMLGLYDCLCEPNVQQRLLRADRSRVARERIEPLARLFSGTMRR